MSGHNARAIARAVRELPVAELEEGARFSRITDSAIRATSAAKLSGTEQRVLEVLLRVIKVDEAGRCYVSQPSSHVARILGTSESSVRRALSGLCNNTKHHGKAPLEVVVHGQPGITAIYRLTFDWGAALTLEDVPNSTHYSVTDLMRIRDAGIAFTPRAGGAHSNADKCSKGSSGPTAEESTEDETKNCTDNDISAEENPF